MSVTAVLGIDAAWTATQPSGVALCVEEGGRWVCKALAPSYADFVGLAEKRPVDWRRPGVEGEAPDVPQLLEAASTLAPGASLRAVALDMPLSHQPISARREADQAISRAFSARKCAVHSPSRTRPGRLSDRFREEFETAGFELATTERPSGPAILEVYPHTALLALCRAPERLPYKVAKTRTYWRGEPPEVRRANLVAQWRRILKALAGEIAFDLPLPRAFDTASSMKRYEDAIDALVCAWVAIEFLGARAVAYGDSSAAIWTPLLLR